MSIAPSLLSAHVVRAARDPQPPRHGPHASGGSVAPRPAPDHAPVDAVALMRGSRRPVRPDPARSRMLVGRPVAR